MKKRILSFTMALFMVLEMLPMAVFATAGLPFDVMVDGEEPNLTYLGDEYCVDDWDDGSAPIYTATTSGNELTITFQEGFYYSCVMACEAGAGMGDYLDVWYAEDGDGTVTINLPVEADHLCVYYGDDMGDINEWYHLKLESAGSENPDDGGDEEGASFAVMVDGEEMTEIEESVLEWSGWMGTSEVTCYTVTVPADAAEATLIFDEEKQWSYYDSMGNYVGDGDSSWTSSTEHTVAIADSNNDGELDGISVQIPNAYSTEYFILFQYATADGGSGETPDDDDESESRPFLSIDIGGEKVAEEDILYKGIFKLGDLDEDEQQEVGDTYNYVHDVPYYYVTVPHGTKSVNVTYPEDADIMNSGSNAYGYKTDVKIEAMASATVRGNTFKDAYTKNADGTQTVVTPVKGVAFDIEGNGHPVTLEGNDIPFKALCLFGFIYEGDHVYDNVKTTKEPTCADAGEKTYTCDCGHSKTEEVKATGEHNYVNGICTGCGEQDPDFKVAIPEGTNIAEITAVTGFAQGEEITFDMWGMTYEVPSYIATVPADTITVTLTFKSGTYPTPYDDYYTGALSLSGAWVTCNEDEDTYSGKGSSHTPTAVGDTHSIELNVADMIENGKYYCAYDTLNNPLYLLGFEYPAGAHVHEYTKEEITTPATCVADGEKTLTCSCGESIKEVIKTEGHQYDDGVETTAPTCTADGVKTFTCTRVNCTAETVGHTKTEKIGKLGHQYNDGEETTAPTCTADGVKTFTCTRENCTAETEGHTKTEAIKTEGHKYENGKCTVCGDVCPVQDENRVYQIGTYEELLWFAKAVNGGNTAIKGALTADITVAVDWPGIGNSTNKFGGDFDGQNHTVTLSGSTWGLFGYVMGTHKDHNLQDAVEIKNVILDGTVKNSALIQSAGYAKVSNCINKADITGRNSYVAGIIGTVIGSNKYGLTYSDVLIENCGNEGDIAGDSNVGGILGYSQTNTRLNSCYNTGDISGSSQVGGLVGYLQKSNGTCEVKNSYNKGVVGGSSNVGGIIGQMYNGAEIHNCYNAGKTNYAMTGFFYNNTSNIVNSYYQADLSTYGEPNNTQTTGVYTGKRAAAKSSADMGSEEIAALLGDAFKASCAGPVLTWQEAVEHVMENGVCQECHYGNDAAVEGADFNAIKSTADGYEIIGDDTVKAGFDYSFTVEILPGYYAEKLSVAVNGTELTADANGTYTVTPSGHFYVTVSGVKAYEGVLPITLPKAGGGYRVTPYEGYTTAVESGRDFKFTVSFVEGFKKGENFAVKANDSALTPDADGVYTISNIKLAQKITVEDVDAVGTKSVTIKLDITKGPNNFMEAEANNVKMLDKEVTVPYFDLELYDCEKYYYNPYCYVDENGNVNGQQKAGNRESAYNVVTSMHAFIYMTEVYYLGYDPEDAGQGLSDMVDSDKDGVSDFDEAVSWTQGVGSSFMNLWGAGTNLNYHLNYAYPLAYPKWGSTSDQQALNDGDVLSVHFITGSASGSAFGFFAINDTDNDYDGDEAKDSATVKQGEKIKLTHYLGDQGTNYTTRFVTGPNKDLYWVEKGNETTDVTKWNRTNFGAMTEETFKTDENGVVTIDTTGLAAGTYYIAAVGGFTAGSGQAGDDNYVSRGAEAGPAYFKLIIEENENEPTVLLGNVNGDGAIDTIDAAAIISFYYGKVEFTDEQKKVADVAGETAGEIDTIDAAAIISFYYGKITEFPRKTA